MRPGHCAPEKGRDVERTVETLRFNEAGALCPGKGSASRLTMAPGTTLQ